MNFSAAEYTRQVQKAAAYIKEKLNGRKPEIAITLGSGLGDLAEQLTDAVQIPYGDIPHFPISTVAGHKGQFVVGKLEGREVLCMQGRFHYYEGYAVREIAALMQANPSTVQTWLMRARGQLKTNLKEAEGL